MLSRLLQLYREGGLNNVRAGIIRFLRIQRREFLHRALKQTSDPKRWLRTYICLRKRLQQARYTDADPFKVIYIDPDDINYRVTNTPTAWGRVSEQRWERKPFEKIKVHGAYFHKSNILHFEKGVPWEQTPIYEARINSRGNNLRGHTTKKDVETYFEQLDTIYRDISESGYRTQKALLHEDSNAVVSSNNDELHPTLNEIGVNIGKDGEYLWSRCGKHRLSIAKILDLDRIPVQVRTRHTSWQEIRNEVRHASSINDLSEKTIRNLNHSDLSDIVPENWKRGSDCGCEDFE